ncbi:MAG: acyl-CoA dehydrogenase family protein [Acidimicrobiales bacterium]
MEFSANPAAARLAAEVRAFLAEHLTDDVRAEMRRTGTFHHAGLHRAMAERGWVEAAVPGAPGGHDPFELAAVFAELELAEAPYHGLATTMIVAGVLSRCASPSLRDAVLPRIVAGEVIVSLGYSEPDSGSDVAAARTRAEPVDEAATAWRINGQKMWTSLADVAQYVLLLTRTDPDAPKHRGLTMFLVPLDADGVSIRPVRTMGDERTNATFYDDVVVGDDHRVGGVHEGWSVMAVALAFERGVVGGALESTALYHHVRRWAAETPGPDGRPLVDRPAWRQALALARIDNEVSWLLSQRSAWLAASGALPSVEGSMVKLFATQAYQRAANRFAELAGPAGLLGDGEPGAAAGGAVDRSLRHAPVTTIYGGTSEIQRNNIAERHLGLPRSRPPSAPTGGRSGAGPE